jgi:prophage endopeptidase
MNDSKEKADADLNQAKTALAAKNNQYLTALHDGSLRLSIPVSPQAGCTVSATGDGQARAELDGQVSEALIAITNDGDQAIVQLNSCIDRYNQIKEIVSGNK